MAAVTPGGGVSPTPGPAHALAPVVVGGGAPSAGAVVFDPAPHINAVEHGLRDWLNKPSRDILDQLGGDPTKRADQRPDGDGTQAGAQGAGGDMVSGLMSPMLQLLGTLGTGIFQGLNPQQMFQPMTQAFQQGAQSLQGLMGQMGSGGGWAGQGAVGTATKTAATLGNGAAVSAQGADLGAQGSMAGANTSQGYTRLLELIQETQHRLEALSGGIPWTAPEMGETAGTATGRAIEIVSELEATLTAQAGAMTASGAPVAVTEAPTQMMSMVGPMMQVAMSMIGPGVQMATMPLTMASQMLTQGVQAGTQAATSLAQSLGKGATGPAPKAITPPTLASSVSGAGAPKLASGAGLGGGGAGTVAARALPSAAPTNLAAPSEPASASQGAGIRAVSTTAAVGGSGMMGGAGMAGAGQRGAGMGSNSHSAANFLHTSDQGGEIIGDLGNVAPPVIGEADPHADVDVELRI